MNKIFMTIFVIMFSNIIQYSQNLKIELKIELKIDKENYVIGEPIVCEILVINPNSYDVLKKILGQIKLKNT